MRHGECLAPTRSARFTPHASRLTLYVSLFLLLLLAACAPASIELVAPDGAITQLDRRVLKEASLLYGGDEGVPLEYPLYAAGYRVIETLVVTGADGSITRYDWPAAAEGSRWLGRGQVEIGGQAVRAARIEAIEWDGIGAVQATLADIAPTAAAALGIPAPASATGRVLVPGLTPPTEDWRWPAPSKVVLIFLDGFGYVRYTEAREAELIPTLAALGEPLLGLSAFVPCTQVGSAVVLTGALPERTGVVGRGMRTTPLQTLPDAAAEAGRSVVAVEGDALAFNMRSAEITLSGDLDGDGDTNDNVLANALAALEAGQPELFWVHFHGIDDAGHSYGPGAPEEVAAVAEVDAAVGQILKRLEARTVVILFADHGQHGVEGDASQLGNHGNLIARDMLVPIWVTVVE